MGQQKEKYVTKQNYCARLNHTAINWSGLFQFLMLKQMYPQEASVPLKNSVR